MISIGRGGSHGYNFPEFRSFRMAVLAEQPMVRRNDTAVKMDAEVVRDAKIVAAYKERSLAEYLSELVRPLIARDMEQEHARRMKAAKGAKGSKE
jgi:hypothetical protein